MKKYEYYTDTNIIDLPIFSSSRSIDSNETETIQLQKNGNTTYLKITYPKKKLSYYDRLVYAGIEYLFSQKYDFKNIRNHFEVALPESEKEFCTENAVKRNNLSLAEKQEIIQRTIEKVKVKHRLYFPYSALNDIISQTYQHGKIKKSLEKISNTIIEQKSDFIIDGSKIEFSFQLADVRIIKSENRHSVSIGLNPFSVYNIVTGYSTKSNIRLLTSFTNSIAGRLSELLQKSLYGARQWKKEKVIYSYDYLVDYLQLKRQKTQSKQIAQLEKSLYELVNKKVIVGFMYDYDLFKNLSIAFYHDYRFFETFINTLPESEKRKINKSMSELLHSTEYENFFMRVEKFIDTVPKKTSKAEKEMIKHYYRKYLIHTEYTE